MVVVCLSLVLVGRESRNKNRKEKVGIGSIVRLGRRVGLGFGFSFLGVS